MTEIMEIVNRHNFHLIFEIFNLLLNIICSLMKSVFHYLIPPKEKTVKGELVLVTGAGHGIGRQLALEFATQGARVICLDIDEGRNKAIVLTVHVKGYEAYGIRCDVGDRKQIELMAKRVKDTYGDVNIIVNNAGIMPVGGLLDTSDQEIVDTFKVNILSHFWMLKAFLPYMVKKRSGHVVAISSMCGVSGVADMAAYCSTKFAIRGLMEAAAEEVRMIGLKDSIFFTTVFPFYVDTGLAPDPHYRFPWLFSAVDAESAAKKIVKAVRQNCTELSIPGLLLQSTNIIRLFPKEVICLIMDFLSGKTPKKINH